jgi:hypothetical protein
LNVLVAPAASVCVKVKVHAFDVVHAEVPVPVRGLSVEPEGTASLVQCTPAGTSKDTAKPTHACEPLFLTASVPQ